MNPNSETTLRCRSGTARPAGSIRGLSFVDLRASRSLVQYRDVTIGLVKRVMVRFNQATNDLAALVEYRAFISPVAARAFLPRKRPRKPG